MFPCFYAFVCLIYVIDFRHFSFAKQKKKSFFLGFLV